MSLETATQRTNLRELSVAILEVFGLNATLTQCEALLQYLQIKGLVVFDDDSNLNNVINDALDKQCLDMRAIIDKSDLTPQQKHKLNLRLEAL